MNDRLKIASEQMAALLGRKIQPPVAVQAERALAAADALLAEHERTSAKVEEPAPRAEWIERCAKRLDAAATTPHEIPESVVESSEHERTSAPQCPSSDPTDTFDCQLNVGHGGDHLSGNDTPQADGAGLLDTHNYRNEYNALIQLIAEQTYAVGIGETMTAEDRVRRVCDRIRELEATVQRQADMLAAKPTPPAASPTGEIPGDVVRVIRDAYFLRNQRGNSCDAMRAALNEYDRQMPALRGRVLDTALCCVSPQGRVIGVYQQRHFAEEAATVCGGTVHRVALVEMEGKP